MTEAYKIDISRGVNVSTLSSQWASRPADQRFLSLDTLYDATLNCAKESYKESCKAGGIEAVALNDKEVVFRFGDSDPMPATNIAFSQICNYAGAPSRYMAKLPADLVAKNLNYGLAREDDDVNREGYVRRPGDPEKTSYARGFTSPDYGRIYDHDIVAAVKKLAADGNWKVPGVMDWSTMTHNPNVDVTKDTTTLYASDRDLFLFLCDDHKPIEIGKLANGDPDLLFRGFYATNSEIGYSRFSLATMYLRGICQNRNLWGVEGFSELRIRHTKGAPLRFIQQAEPALLKFAEADPKKVIAGVMAAKSATVATDEDERNDFLMKLGFSKKQATIIATLGEEEEGKLPETIWDMAQGITAFARSVPHQDKRIGVERIAGNLLDKVAVPA